MRVMKVINIVHVQAFVKQTSYFMDLRKYKNLNG